MRRTLTLIVMLTSTIGFATTATAQRRQPSTRVPDAGMVAVGASIGVAVPWESRWPLGPISKRKWKAT